MLAACTAPSPSAQAATNGAFEDVGQLGLRTIPLTITGATGTKHRFIVEVAKTSLERERGLMFRQSLGPDRGMIFLFDPPQSIAFWMKNTLIPLDMLFIGADGRVLNIIENAAPLSLSPRPSAGDAAMVLEIAGGRASALGIKAGDKVDY